MKYFFILLLLSICPLFFLLSNGKVKENKCLHQQKIQKEEAIFQTDSSFIRNLLYKNKSLFKLDIDQLNKYEVQIIYTRIDRDSLNHPHFTKYTYNLNDTIYFNPASLVKLPVILLSLEKLNKLNIPGLTRNSRMKLDSAHTCQSRVYSDYSSQNHFPTISNYIKKILLVSDNDAYNRLYDFIGQQELNEHLWKMGYKKTYIIQRFNTCCNDCNRFSSPLAFYDKKNHLIYHQKMMVNNQSYKNPLGEIKIGKGYINSNGKYINGPMNFTFSNNFPLNDIYEIFLSLIFPENVSKEKRFNLTVDDYKFLYKYLSMYPRESTYPSYKNEKYFPDNLKKYFLWGSTSKNINDTNIRILNIVGQHLGYLADCAYIVDFNKKTEFILTAVINTNVDQIYNSADYKYSTIGFPFLEQLGKIFYDYELQRKRAFSPDLSKLYKIIHSSF